ncbi:MULTISPECIES: APC family permease [Clostridium]|uniref:APC family permease n=1 Tax=Clostridium TaxID=1485 RepID=UPI0006BFF63E|nr:MULTISPECIES: APC family permease [Clostridium]CUO61572.1 amino acid permease family protein [Clostridium disporicum]
MPKEDKFERVLNKKDVFVLAFGAMIGWGWVVLSGEWILKAGTVGAMIAFALGGLMVLFVGLTYAELTAAMPKCGGEHVFSYRALGRNASFICTWAIVLGYISVVAFEAVAFPTVMQYLFPSYMKVHLYSVAGFDIYLTWLLVGVISSILIAAVNYFGVKPAARFQGILTIVIAIIGLSLITGSLFNGEVSNVQPLFKDGVNGIIAVAVMTPFMYVGFDVIPQAAEEMNIPFKKIGQILILSVVMAVVWYVAIIGGVSLAMSSTQIETSELVTADAMANVFFNSPIASKVLIIGGIAGILTSWNSFYVGGSRAIYSMAESGMIPSFLARLHPKYKTPCNAVILVGVISSLAPFLGRKMLVWLSDAGGLTIVVAYLIVSISFLVLRKKEPEMSRPYKVKHGKLVGTIAVIMCVVLAIMYLPGSPAALGWPYEWGILIAWTVLGSVFFVWAKVANKYEKQLEEKFFKEEVMEEEIIDRI